MTLTRKTPLRGTGKIKAKKRTAGEFARIYGSKKRVEFVKHLPCANCGRVASTSNEWLAIVNAHVENGGLSRKSDYQNIIPLCSTIHRDGCHDMQHEYGWAYLANLRSPLLAASAAEDTEAKWLAHLAGGLPERTR